MSDNYFKYGTKETDYLKSKDKKMAEVIDRIGKIYRSVIPDLFEALMHAIVGQQISTKAQISIWEKMKSSLHIIDAETIATSKADELQKVGLSFRKVKYMQDIAKKIVNKELNLTELYAMEDECLAIELSKLRGIGVWTAEMIMIFSMQRPNIISYGDLAILRGLRMLYHHRTITTILFNKYRKRYSPYASVASLYLWAIAGGAIPEMKDYAPKTKK